MKEIEKDFLRLAVVEQVKYDDISIELKVDNKELTRMWDSLKKEREELSNIRKIWKNKFDNTKSYDSFWKFRDWYLTSEKKCYYCKISEDEINLLWKRDSQLTKRLRGKKLEIERRLPNEPYDNIKNLVYSCYWCNNAKTDTFTDEEFKPIGEEIGKVWKRRLEL